MIIMREMRISLFSQSLFALPLAEAIEMTARIGFPAIELACAKPHFDVETAIENPNSVAERIRKAGLEVSALSLFNNFTDKTRLDAQIEKAVTYIRLAPLFHTKILKMTPGQPASADAMEEHWRCLGLALERLTPVAEEVGVRLAFETHMRQLTDTLAGAKRLLEMAKTDVVGLTLDFSNFMFAGEDMREVISALEGRIYNTHVKNGTVDEDGGWHFNALDDGLTDYLEVLSLLRDTGYTGYLAIECLGADASEKPFETAKRDLDILKNYLERIGYQS
jgi:sugar phosphate isomerase/epimerase